MNRREFIGTAAASVVASSIPFSVVAQPEIHRYAFKYNISKWGIIWDKFFSINARTDFDTYPDIIVWNGKKLHKLKPGLTINDYKPSVIIVDADVYLHLSTEYVVGPDGGDGTHVNFPYHIVKYAESIKNLTTGRMLRQRSL